MTFIRWSPPSFLSMELRYSITRMSMSISSSVLWHLKMWFRALSACSSYSPFEYLYSTSSLSFVLELSSISRPSLAAMEGFSITGLSSSNTCSKRPSSSNRAALSSNPLENAGLAASIMVPTRAVLRNDLLLKIEFFITGSFVSRLPHVRAAGSF